VPGEYTFPVRLSESEGSSTSQRASLKCLSVDDVLMVDACAKDQGMAARGKAAGGAAAGEGAAGSVTAVRHAELRMSDYVAAAAQAGEGPSVSGKPPVSDMYKNLKGLVDTVVTGVCLPLLATSSGPSAQAAGASSQAQGQGRSAIPVGCE